MRGDSPEWLQTPPGLTRTMRRFLVTIVAKSAQKTRFPRTFESVSDLQGSELWTAKSLLDLRGSRPGASESLFGVRCRRLCRSESLSDVQGSERWTTKSLSDVPSSVPRAPKRLSDVQGRRPWRTKSLLEVQSSLPWTSKSLSKGQRKRPTPVGGVKWDGWRAAFPVVRPGQETARSGRGNRRCVEVQKRVD